MVNKFLLHEAVPGIKQFSQITSANLFFQRDLFLTFPGNSWETGSSIHHLRNLSLLPEETNTVLTTDIHVHIHTHIHWMKGVVVHFLGGGEWMRNQEDGHFAETFMFLFNG